jgi:deoxyribonuclease-4
MRKIGLHLRLQGSYDQLIQQAVELQVPVVQFFLTQEGTGKHRSVELEECTKVKELLDLSGIIPIVHSGYAINLGSRLPGLGYLLERELKTIRHLHVKHMVFHPGSAKEFVHRGAALRTVLWRLNELLAQEPDLTVYIENVPFAEPSIGGNLEELARLRAYCSYPNRLKLCLDTAHAHAFGYSIVTPADQEVFLENVIQWFGADGIGLLHLNDTTEGFGTKHDKHALVGEGTIGKEPLKEFILKRQLVQVPIIMEMPATTLERQIASLNEIRSFITEPL